MNFYPVQKIEIAWALRLRGQFISFLLSLQSLLWSWGNMSGSQLLPAFQLDQAYCEGLCEVLSKVPDESPNLSPNLQGPHEKPMLWVSSTEPPTDLCCLVALWWGLVSATPHISFSFFVPLSAPRRCPWLCKESGSPQHNISSSGCLMLAILCTSSI